MPSAPPEAAVPFPQIQYHLLLQQEELQAWKPCLQAGSTMSQAPSQLHLSLLQLLPLSCFLLLLLLELELRLMRALISSLPTPAPPELLLSEGHCLGPMLQQSKLPWLSTDPGNVPPDRRWVLCCSDYENRDDNSVMYRAWIPVMFPLLFAHLQPLNKADL